MQATRARAGKTKSAAVPSTQGHSEREVVESIFAAYGLPGWLGWGTYGAESTYGSNGTYKFGGIDLPFGTTTNTVLAARESARAYAKLVNQYGSVNAAVPHYSGNSYTVSHVEELGKGNAGGEGTAVNVLDLNPLHTPLFESLNPFNWIKPNLGETPPGKEPGRVTGGASAAISSIGGLIELLTSGETWLRLGEILAGAVLIFLGLKGLTGVDFPSAIPVPV
jgi:hypothetical protein